MNSRGFQRRKVIERTNKALDYFTTLFVRMRLHEECQIPRQDRPLYGCITIFKNGKYEYDFINDMPF